MYAGALNMRTVLSLLVAMMASVILTAPVAKDGIEGIKEALKSQIKDQEQALESLTRLTNSNTDGPKGIELSKMKSFSYSNINGAETKEQQEEEKVSDPVTSKVISDINEKLEQKQESPEQKPKTSFQASVDIPAQGIHKQISTDGEIDTNLPEMKDTIEFTPEVVAEYLRGEGKVQEFQDLLNELVDNNEITTEEAEQYEKSVMDAFYNQEQKEEDNNDMTDVESLYPVGFGDGPQPMFPMYNAAPFQNKDEVYPFAYDQMPLVPGGQMGEDRMVEDYSPISLDEMISYLLDEWLSRAVVTGDPEAAEILSNIIDYVSRDNNPNDEEQVKAILGDIIAETLLEDLTPRLEPLPVQDLSLLQGPMQPVMPSFPFPAQPQQQPKQPETETSSNDADTKGEKENTENKTDEKTEQTQEKTDDLEEQLKM